MSTSNNFMENDAKNTNEKNIPSKTIESKTIFKKAEETLIQQKFSRLKTSEDNELLKNSSNPTVKTTVKTYTRKVIRKRGPNGECTEEIIETGDLIPENTFPTEESTGNDEECKSKVHGKTEMQASYGVRTTFGSGEEENLQYSTGPMEISHISDDNLKTSYPVGATVKKTFLQEKVKTVTLSSTVNGESKVLSSKSTFLNVSGKSDLKIHPSEEESITNENESTENQKENSQDVEKSIEKLVKNFEQSAPCTRDSQKTSENVSEIIEENIIPTKKLNNDGKNITITRTKLNKEESQRLLKKLSKSLEFNNNFSKINVIDKQLIMEGKVQAMEDLQTTPAILKKISDGRMLKLYLIMFDDLFILAVKKKPKKFKVIECCLKNEVKADCYSFPGQLKSNLFIPKSNAFACVSKSYSKKDISNNLFSLKFKKEITKILKDPIILTAPTIETRDQWVSVISHGPE